MSWHNRMENRPLSYLSPAAAAAAAGALINLGLFFVKFYIGLSTNSVSIYADSLNNLLDFLGCAAASAGLILLGGRANSKYPYGFGRAEDITDFILSLSVVITAFYFGYISLERLFYPIPVWYSGQYALLLAATLGVKALLAAMFGAAAKKLRSAPLRAMFIDSLLDLFITASTIVSFTLSEKVSYSLDGVSGIIIAAVLLVEGAGMLKAAFAALLGQRDEKLCAEALKLLSENGVDAGNINCHSYGKRRIFTFTAASTVAPEKAAALDRIFEKELNSEIYYKNGGNEHEKESYTDTEGR